MRISREKVSEFEWLSNPNTFYVFMRLLFKANFKDGRREGIEVKRGQLITGRKALGGELNLSEQQIRTCLDKLEKTGYITIKSTNKYSIVTICNYDSWQNDFEDSNQQITNNQPTNNQQITTIEINKECKEDNKKEEDTNVSKKKVPVTELEKLFDAFRTKYSKYGGKVRGFSTELDDFKKKHKDWKEIIPLLDFALEQENHARKQAEAKREFFAQMKNLRTYLNQRAWEAYTDGYEDFDPTEYRPTVDGIFQYWDEKNKRLIFNGDIEHLDDGYTAENRPDGATASWGMYSWRWSRELKSWIKR